MPTIEQVQSFIQTLFPGQLVLYPPQLAQLIGRSEKALQHLIDRGSLPFEVKKIGNRRCVDIFRVAEWLSREEKKTTEPRQTSSEKPTRARSTPATKRRSLGGKLLEMRSSAAVAMRCSLGADSEVDEADSFVQAFISSLLQPESDDELIVDALITVVVKGRTVEGRATNESFVRIVDAAERVIDLRSQQHVVAGEITVSRKDLPIYVCSLAERGIAGFWDTEVNLDSRFVAWLAFIQQQASKADEGLLEFSDERLPMQWFSAQSLEVRREVRALCAFSVPAEFFQAIAANFPIVRDAELIALFHDTWSCLPSRLVFDIAIGRINSTDELDRFNCDAKQALGSPESVTEFEDIFRLEDELQIVWTWLRGHAYQAKFGMNSASENDE